MGNPLAPKVEDGVILHSGATVLGNVRVGKGAVVTAKSIVTKPVPALARVSGVPATVKSFRDAKEESRLADEGDEEGELREKAAVNHEIMQLYESYFEKLETLTEMERDLDSEKSIQENYRREAMNEAISPDL